ncbi:MAG: hypothetical protein JWQ04_964, partial [Pedosphaera sp.]|nr:hypothetical protein [Pedosphaera sp.]
TFAVVNYPSETGQFAATQLPALPVNLQWQTNYGVNALTLKVIKSTGTYLSSPARLTNGHFQFTLNGSSATSAIIQGSTNLITWIPLQTNTPFTGTVQFDDANATSYSDRFYRVQIQP